MHRNHNMQFRPEPEFAVTRKNPAVILLAMNFLCIMSMEISDR